MKEKKTKIVIYPFGKGWYVKIIYPFKTDGGATIFESAIARCENLSFAKRLANRIRRVHEDKSIPTVVEVVERDKLV